MTHETEDLAPHLALLSSAIDRATPDRRPLMLAHLRAQKRVWTMKAGDFASPDIYVATFDEAVADEGDALRALAEAPCGPVEAFVAKLEYLAVVCRAEAGQPPSIGEDYGAVAIAVDAFLQEPSA